MFLILRPLELDQLLVSASACYPITFSGLGIDIVLLPIIWLGPAIDPDATNTHKNIRIKHNRKLSLHVRFTSFDLMLTGSSYPEVSVI